MPSFPTLIVSDPEASSNYYQRALGFKHVFTMLGPDGKPSLVHLRWVQYADLLLMKPRDGKESTDPKGLGVALHFSMFDQFNGDIDAFTRQARENGANVTGPIDQPWNVREVMVIDPDGYRLVFAAPITINMKFDDMLERVQQKESK